MAESHFPRRRGAADFLAQLEKLSFEQSYALFAVRRLAALGFGAVMLGAAVIGLVQEATLLAETSIGRAQEALDGVAMNDASRQFLLGVADYMLKREH